MGKVASSSISVAILDANLACHDIHTLDRDYLHSVANTWLERGEFPPPHVCVAMAHRDRLLVNKTKCLYITLVRDPLERNLSAFFQNLQLQDKSVRDELDAGVMFENFMRTYTHSIPLSWLNREFKGQLNIDLLSRPFDTKKRFSYYSSFNTIVFRVDCPDDEKSRMLTKLLGQPINVRRENDSNDKEYKALYAGVKSKAKFTPDFLDRIYNSSFSRHYWTPAEREEMAKRWLNPGDKFVVT